MNIEERYQYWLSHPNVEETLKKELESMSPQEINDAFYTEIEFGTAGVRGVLGAGINRINIHTIRKANAGFIKYILKYQANSTKSGVAIGYDNRHMSYELAVDSAKMMAASGIKAYVFESLRPTPELSFAVRHLNCFGGIMITASHNPKEYNGYKTYDETGCQLVPKLANEVIQYVNEVEDLLALTTNIDEHHCDLIEFIGETVDEAYYKEVLNIQIHPEVNKDLKIVFSPEHGASYLPVMHTLKAAGYHVILVEEQAQPDPDFSNTPTPNPEEKGAYQKALEYAVKHDADLVLVCDPDGDRMGVAAKNNKGEFELITGNQTGALLAEYIFSQLHATGAMPENPVMFNTVVTSDLGEKVASHHNVVTEKTLTGFKFIGEKVAKYEVNNERQYVFGYEESYGSLIKDFVRDKDATQACLMLAEAACFYAESSKTLIDVIEELYDRHGAYEDTQTSIMLKGQKGAEELKALIARFRENPPVDFGGIQVVAHEDFSILKHYKNNTETDLVGFVTSDVLKYYLEDGSWIAIRPSGTEPKCKFYYCIKADTVVLAKEKTSQMHQVIETMIK
ncbi:MAG: phospho-sugar mutase [Erysipelotrichaceae bacterium]